MNLGFKRIESGGDVRISFAKDGSWTYLGRQCLQVLLAEPTMNLEGIDPKTPDMTPCEMRDILHEVGHMLGLVHEHQSPARKGVLTFKKQGES